MMKTLKNGAFGRGRRSIDKTSKNDENFEKWPIDPYLDPLTKLQKMMKTSK
jgi:hypothetical protein